MVTQQTLSLAARVETLEQDKHRLNALVDAERREKEDWKHAYHQGKVESDLEIGRLTDEVGVERRIKADAFAAREGLIREVVSLKRQLVEATNRANDALGDWQDRETILQRVAYLQSWVNEHTGDRAAWDADRTRLEAEIERLLEVGESSDAAWMEKVAYLQQEVEAYKSGGKSQTDRVKALVIQRDNREAQIQTLTDLAAHYNQEKEKAEALVAVPRSRNGMPLGHWPKSGTRPIPTFTIR